MQNTGENMNAIERKLLKTAEKLVYNFFAEELENHRTELERKKDEKFYYDVLNSGILLDVNKLKLIGINNLQKALRKRELKL